MSSRSYFPVSWPLTRDFFFFFCAGECVPRHVAYTSLCVRAPGQRCREWRHESVAASRRVSAPRDERTRSLEKTRNYSRVVTSSPPTPHPVTSLTENGCDVAGQVVAGKQLIDGEEEEGEEEGIMRKKGSRRGERRSLTIYSERASRSWLLLIVMMVVMKMMLLRTAVSSQRHWVTEHVHVHDLPRKGAPWPWSTLLQVEVLRKCLEVAHLVTVNVPYQCWIIITDALKDHCEVFKLRFLICAILMR